MSEQYIKRPVVVYKLRDGSVTTNYGYWYQDVFGSQCEGVEAEEEEEI